MPNNLDGQAGRRSHELTRGLKEVINSKLLWDEYGIDDDITVCISPLTSQLISQKIKPFTTHFPRADIHDMLSPDILHQLIKGTFKDRLVQWVCDYLHLTHGETHAQNILDDIDRR